MMEECLTTAWCYQPPVLHSSLLGDQMMKQCLTTALVLSSSSIIFTRRSYDGGVFNHWCYQPPVLHSQPTPILQHQGKGIWQNTGIPR